MEQEFEDAHGSTTNNGLAQQNGAKTAQQQTATEVYKVAARVPPFWPEEPEIWFAQVEGQFDIAGITADSTKFNYVIGQLDNKFSREVKDIIISPPASGKYEKLKTELIRRLSASNEKKLKQLLMHEELGDRKPSQFLRHLKSLAGVDVTDEFLKTIWMSRLPHGIQTVLAGQPSTSTIDDLADLSDRVNELASSTPRVAAVSQPVPSSVLSDLTKEVAELRKQMQQLTANQRGRSRQPNRSRSTSRQRSNSSYRKFPLCWYHGKFGENAKKCILPCDFKAGNAPGNP